MPLNLIIGRSNSGKSKLMYETIASLEREGKKAIVFVPDFARIVAEQEYFKYTQNLGMANTKITTLDRFAKQKINANEFLGTREFLPEMSKKYIIKKCIMDNGELLNIFNKVKNSQGFADKLYKFTNIFESESIEQEKIDKLLNENTFLSQKFKEIYDIYKVIEDTTRTRFVTGVEVLDFYTKRVLDGAYSSYNTSYFFDCYNNFSKKEFEFIKALLTRGESVTITIDLDIENVELADIFEIPYNTYKRLKDICNQACDKCSETILRTVNVSTSMLQALQKNIFVLGADRYLNKDNTVQIKLLKNPCLEIEYIAQDILSQVRTNGYRYSDFKIYYNNPDMYDLNIYRIFKEYGIPVYINSKRNTKGNTFVVYLQNLLEQTHTGFASLKVDNIIQMLKTGLCQFKDEDIYMFENYVNEFGINAYNFSKEFKKNNKDSTSENFIYNLENINKMREAIYTDITNLREKLLCVLDTKEITKIIYEYLQESTVLKKYEEQLEQTKAYDMDEYNKKRQIVEFVYEVMDNIVVAFKELNFPDYVELLKYGLESIEVKSIPPFIDQVEVCDIDSTRSLQRSRVYIIGTFENGLPIMTNSESIFSDKEIRQLESFGIEIAKTSENRNSMALFNVYKAINSCTNNLIITIPSSKITGENLRISPVISKVKDILDIEVNGNVIESLNKKRLCVKNIYEQFVENLATEEQEQNLISDYRLLMGDEKYSKILTYTRDNEKLQEQTVDKLYSKDIFSSISRLEKFNACPFNYFSTYVLKLKDKKEYKLSALDLGSIMHKVLEDFSKFLIQNNKGFEDVITDEKVQALAKEQIGKSIDAIFENMYVKYIQSARYVYLKNKLKKGMLNVVEYISKSFVQSEFRPLGFEVEFDNNALFAPIEVELSGGTKMYLRGKIDRIDTAKIRENVYLRVVDYKSSNKDLKLSDVKEGVSLQLMTYMAALLENKEKISEKDCVLPASITYFTLNTDLLNLSECISEDKVSEKLIEKMKMRGIYLNDVEVLKKLDNKFSEPTYSYIDMTPRRLSNESKSLIEERFLEECNGMKDLLKQIGDNLVTGCTKPSDKAKSCTYCNYSGVCKKTLKSV